MNERNTRLANAEARLQLAGRRPQDRLLALARLVAEPESVSTGTALSMPDIAQLRTLIQQELARVRLPNREVVADQILFMIVGASQSGRQAATSDAWALVYQSIAAFLQPHQRYWWSWSGLMLVSIGMTALLAVSGYAVRQHQTNQQWQLQAAQSETGDVPRSHTVDQLIELYNDMKNGICQMPQAAMLPEKDRQAFLAFVNEGVVDIANADRLKHALDYVYCDYPQTLMQSAKP